MYKGDRMSEYFVQNNRFFGVKGIIGRRNFLVNCLIIEIFEALFWTTPVIYLMFAKPELVQTFQSGVNPFWFTALTAIIGLFSSAFYFSNVVRRIRDIIGEENDNKIYMISAILSVLIFMGYTPAGNILSGRFVGLFILISLIFWEGKITANEPKNEIIKFNWGAFLGTWLWGIFNKSYLTFLIFPLLFTTAWFPFMLICGLKGNEWAYQKKKDKYDSVEKFHSSQQNQTVVFAILTPVMSVLLFGGLLVGAGVFLHKYSKKNPQFEQKFLNVFKNYQISAIEAVFEKIDISDNEYKFYLDPEDWGSDYMQKTAMRNAENYVLIKENNFEAVVSGNSAKQYEAMNRIKIYSTFNNEILAECNINSDDIKQVENYLKDQSGENLSKLMELDKKANNSCKYNQSPTLP